MGQVLTETQPSGGGTTSYAYDLAGRLISLTDPDDNTTTYTYNAANEVVTEKSPTGGLTTYTYDLDRQRLERDRPRRPRDHLRIRRRQRGDGRDLGQPLRRHAARRRSTTPTTPTAS